MQGGVPGSDVTTDDVKAADVIWGQSVLKMKGNTVRRNGKRMAQSIVKVPKELIKLQQDVELAIDCFFVNKHIFLNTMSTKICFTTATHLAYRHGREIGDHPQDVEPSENDDNSGVNPISDVIPGVDPTPDEDAEFPGVRSGHGF